MFWKGILGQSWVIIIELVYEIQETSSKMISNGIFIHIIVLLEFQCALSHPVSDQRDWRAQPGGGGDGRQVQNGGAGGLDQGSHEREQDDVICFSCDR